MSDEKLNNKLTKALDRHQAYERLPKRVKVYFECIAHNAELLYEQCALERVYENQNDLRLDYTKYIFEAAKFANIGFYLEEDIEEVKRVPLKHVELGAELFYRDIHGRDDLKKLTNEDKIIRRLGRDMTLYHHERWDGRGYPDGLYKEEIPITARIVIICCEFLRLTTQKALGKPMTRDEAVEKIVSDSGKAYDPLIIDIFQSIASKFVLYGEEYESYEERLEKAQQNALEKEPIKEPLEAPAVAEAKEAKDKILTPPPIPEAKPKQKRMTGRMSRYLKRERPLHIAYIPIYNSKLKRIECFRSEFLVNAKYYGKVKPEIYANIARKNNQLLQLLEVEVDEVFELLTIRKHLGLEIKPIFIRLYDQTLEKKTIFNKIIDFLKKNEIEPNKIIMEIPESILVSKNKQIKETIKKIRQSGMKIAIYDFGLDYGTLQRLCKFKFDYLEVNKSYIKNLEINPKIIGMAESILDLAHAMGVEAICQGVDSKYLSDVISTSGYELIEGLANGPELTIKEMARL